MNNAKILRKTFQAEITNAKDTGRKGWMAGSMNTKKSSVAVTLRSGRYYSWLGSGYLQSRIKEDFLQEYSDLGYRRNDPRIKGQSNENWHLLRWGKLWSNRLGLARIHKC